MSVDIWVGDFETNFTYNYSPALYGAGMCSWRTINGVPAALCGWVFTRTLAELKRERERYEPLIKGGGEWGTWDDLLERLTDLDVACRERPLEVVRAS